MDQNKNLEQEARAAAIQSLAKILHTQEAIRGIVPTCVKPELITIPIAKYENLVVRKALLDALLSFQEEKLFIPLALLEYIKIACGKEPEAKK